MKISSVSKKVLSGALSAAMVVAFAPTVAFAAPFGNSANDSITVKFNVNGGTVAAEHGTTLADATATLSNGTLTLTGDAASYADWITKGDYEFDYWFVDTNNNGKQDGSEVKSSSKTAIDLSGVEKDTEITLTAAYKKAEVSIGGLSGLRETATAAIDKQAVTVTVASGLEDDTVYYVELAGPGITGVKKSVTATGSNLKTTGVTFADVAVKAGTYTATVKKYADDKAVGTQEAKIHTVTLDKGIGYRTFASTAKTTYLVSDGVDYSTFLGSNNANVSTPTEGETGSYTFSKYVLADGTAAADQQIKGDVTLTAVYSNPQVLSAAATLANTKAGTSTITYTLSGVENLTSNDTNLIEDYTATLETPAGTKTWNIDKRNVTANGNIAVTFNGSSEGQATAGAAGYTSKDAIAAGEYKLSLKANLKTDAPAGTKVASVAPKALTIAPVSYDLNGGSWTKDGEDYTKIAVNSFVVADTKWTSTPALANLSSAQVKAPEKQAIDYIEVAGVKSSDISATKPVAVAASGVTVKVVYKAAEIEAPTYTAEKVADGEYKLNFASSVEGATLKYQLSTDGSTYGTAYNVPADGITIKTSKYKAVKAIATDKKGISGTVELVLSTASVNAFKTFADNALNVKTFDSTTAKPQVYADVLTTAKADGAKALEDKVIESTTEWDADLKAQKRSLLEQIAALATAKLDAQKAMTKSSDGKTYTYMTDEQYAAAKANIDQVLVDFDGLNDEKATTQYKATAKKNKDSVITNAPADYATALTYAVTSAAKTTVQVADVEAAQAVDAQINKLAADYATVTRDNYVEAAAAAADAQTDYAALTAAQKALVTADIQTIASVIADAAEIADQVKDEETAKKLADAQDQAAANLLYSKTVTAKAKVGKKAQGKSFTYKLGASESGAVATYAKASGSKYIKVSASGKVTFSKVKAAKKAKTYKAKVTVTYGTKTCTKTVTYKVVKK